jgi:ATP-binding cassette subfamily C protein CydC
MRILKLINSFMKKQILFVILSILLGVFTILSNIGLLSTSAVLISKASLHPDVLSLMVLIVVVRFFGIARGVCRYFERIFSHDTTFRILSGIRQWFYKSFNENYSETKSFKTGDIYTKLVKDVDRLRELYLRGIYPLIIAILTGLITCMFISYFSTKVAFLYILIYAVAGFLFPIILFKLNNNFLKKELAFKSTINTTLLDLINGIIEVNLYPLKEQFINKLNDLNEKLTKIEKHKNFINILGNNIQNIFFYLIISLTLVVSAPLVFENKLQGIYYAMLPLTILASFEALLPMITMPYKFKEANDSGNSIYEVIGDFNDKFKNTKNYEEINDYHISLQKISVYDEVSNKFILKDIFLDLPYKKKIAIVGASGSGKSTLIKTILGFIKYTEGKIEIGNKDYRDLSIDDIRNIFTAVEQGSYVFNTTIKENLLIANTEAEDSNILKLLEKFKLTDLINKNEKGLDTILGQFGYNISGGEKQRLMLLRALLKPSKIIILDEPTSSLDIETESKVINAIHEHIEDKSCIWITHRLVNMDKFHEILVIDKGEIIERGNHEQLIALKGKYYEFWHLQNNYLNI